MLRKLWRELSRSRAAPQTDPAGDVLAELRAELGRGDVASAGARVRALPKSHPALAAGACALGEFHQSRGEPDAAREYYFLALRSNPLSVEARIGLGLSYYDGGDLEEALVQVRTALLVEPGDPECAIQEGVIHLRWGNLEYAAQRLEEGLAIAPDNPHGWNNLGVVRQRRGDVRGALSCFQRAVAIRPAYATAHGNLGLALREFERLDEARQHLERAVELRPESADGHVNLGTLLVDLGDLAGAARAYARALEIAPRHAEALLGLGIVAQRRGDLESARALVADSLAVNPGYAAARTSLAEIQLSLGEFAAGWANYESRLDTPQAPRLALPFPEWRGERLPDGTLLVYWEQGLGDVILFGSCLPEVLPKVGRLVLNLPDPLAPLFARSLPTVEIVTGARDATGAWTRSLGEVTACAAIGSLMYHCRPDRASFPERVAFLRADPARVAAWRRRLNALGGGRKLGVSWRGGLARTGRAQRSLAPAALRALFDVPKTTWVSVQYGDCSAELAELERGGGPTLHHWPEAIADFDELAGLLVALDGVVTVCNTTAHLAGALGVPGVVLAPRGASWRYQTTEAVLPWYPSLQVLRQRAEGDWAPVIAAAGRAVVASERLAAVP